MNLLFWVVLMMLCDSFPITSQCVFFRSNTNLQKPVGNIEKTLMEIFKSYSLQQWCFIRAQCLFKRNISTNYIHVHECGAEMFVNREISWRMVKLVNICVS